MRNALCKISVLLGLLLCYLPVQGQCNSEDCAPIGGGTTNVVINVPWSAGGGPGCVLFVTMTTRICQGPNPDRCEVTFSRIEQTDCCSTAFSSSNLASVVAAVRLWLYLNPQLANCDLLRIIHPRCWAVTSTTVLSACEVDPCCYIEGTPESPPGALQTTAPSMDTCPTSPSQCYPTCGTL